MPIRWTVLLAVPVLADAIFFGGSAQKRSKPPWPSPAHDDCLGSERGRRLFQEAKAALHEDPLNFAVINGTTWKVVNRSDHTIATVDSAIYRTDLGTDPGIMRFAMLCEDYAEREGYYDMVFDVLHNVDRFPPEQGAWAEMKCWVSLSDHAATGTAALADYGGPNAGVEFIVRRLQANPEPHKLVYLGQLTLRYEIQMNLWGMLATDVDNKRGAAAMAAGAAEELVHTLRVEHDFCSPLYTACASMNLLILHNSSYAAKFKQLGARELAANAAKQCATPISDFVLMDWTYGEIHPAGATCAYSAALLQE